VPDGSKLHELLGGEIVVWVDSGTICIKLNNTYGDPVELSDDGAIELAELLLRLAKEQQGPVPARDGGEDK